MLKTWSPNEVPNRAPPLPEHVLHAMVGWSFFHEQYSFGVSLMLGYYAMLRTGELLGLKAAHLLCEKGQPKIIVSLGLTKGGKRQGAAESCVVGYDKVVKLVQQWKAIASPTTGFTPNPARWRTLFNEALVSLKLQHFGSVRTVSGEAVPHGGSHATIPWIKFWYKGVGRRQKPLEFTSMRDYPYWRNFNFPLPSLPLLRFSPFFVIIPLPPIFGHLSLPAKCGEEQGDVESLKEARGRENPAVGIWQSISSLFFLQTLT